jgi:hypothetical protein
MTPIKETLTSLALLGASVVAVVGITNYIAYHDRVLELEKNIVHEDHCVSKNSILHPILYDAGIALAENHYRK